MRISTLVLMGASTLALSGCSFIGGLFGHDKGHHGAYSHHDGGTYHACGGEKCVGGKEISKWNVEGGIGPAFVLGGDAVTSSGLNPGNPNPIRSAEMGDAYDDGLRAELGVSYMLNPNRKLTGTVFHQQHDSAGSFNWGSIGGQNLTGGLSDYKATGVEVGLRQYALPRYVGQSNLQFRPYVEGRVGAAQLDDINIENAQLGGAAFAGGTVPFYEGGVVGTGAGLVGVEFPVADRFTMGLETGVRYMGELKSDGSVLTPGGPISGSNNGGDMWSVPLTLRGRYRF